MAADAVPFFTGVTVCAICVACSPLAAFVVSGVGCGCLGGAGVSFVATFVGGLVLLLTRMSVGLGAAMVRSLGGGAATFDTSSGARTEWSTGGTLEGKGMEGTIWAWMEPVEADLSPQTSLCEGWRKARPMRIAATAMCSRTAPAKPLPSFCWRGAGWA